VASAIAPEQYIAISTARGFIGTGGEDCFAIFEAYERLDFFKVISPSRFSGPCFILCADADDQGLKAVSETGSRRILPPLI
jgi:hypothetical protein